MGALGSDGGFAGIFLDGKQVATIDAYNEEDRYNEGLWGRFDLRPGRHTVRVVVRGEPFPGSSDAWVGLEDLIVFRR